MEMTDALNKINPEKQYSVEEVGGMWIDEQGKNFILQNLTHKDVFVKVLEKMEPIYSHFEKSALMPFYTNFAKAVRKVNTEHILI